MSKIKTLLRAAGSLATGATRSLASSGRDVYHSWRLTPEILEKHESRMRETCDRQRRLTKRHRDLVWDTMAIGGLELTSLLRGQTPSAELKQAYKLAFPNKAQEMDLSDVFAEHQHDPEALQGLVSALKGKLFEQRYLDHLNGGALPEGYTAKLAESPIQSGWDLSVTGPDGELAETYQLKATDAVSYVQDALSRHPEIDVVTTDEVAAVFEQAAIYDTGAVIASGMNNAELTADVQEALQGMEGVPHGGSLAFSAVVVLLARISYTEFNKSDRDLHAVMRGIGSRSIGSALTMIAHAQVGLVTLPARWFLSNRARLGRERRAALERIRDATERAKQREQELRQRLGWRLRLRERFAGTAGAWIPRLIETIRGWFHKPVLRPN